MFGKITVTMCPWRAARGQVAQGRALACTAYPSRSRSPWAIGREDGERAPETIVADLDDNALLDLAPVKRGSAQLTCLALVGSRW